MNAVAEWLATFASGLGSLGAWLVWIALLLALGALPSILPRRATDHSPRSVVAIWIGLLVAAVVVAKGDVAAGWLEGAAVSVARVAGAQSNRLEPLLERLPETTSAWVAQLPWPEIALAAFLLVLVLAFYLPRHSRFGHER